MDTSDSDIVALVHQLDARNPPPARKDDAEQPIPIFLEAKAFREVAAYNMRVYLSSDERARAALMRAAFVDPEEDVRKAAILGLYHASVIGLEELLAAAALDSDESIRQLALEGLNAIQAPSRMIIAKFLINDLDAAVARLATDILDGKPIAYYHLEGAL